MEFTVTLGGVEYACKLPMHTRRQAIMSVLVGQDTTEDEYVCACSAAVAQVLQSPPADLPDWRAFRGDAVSYGEAAAEALVGAGISLLDVVKAGKVVRQAIIAEQPTAQGLEDALDPTEGREGNSTRDMSDSA